MMFGQWMGDNKIKLKEDKDDEFDELMYVSQQTVISMLRQKEKGINSLMQSRRKWKNRYYKIRKQLKQKYDKDTHILQNQLDLANAENVKKDKQIERYQNMLATNDMLHIKESQEKDKVIDLMSEFLNKRSWREHQLKDDTCYCCNVDFGADDCKDCIKQYFEDKAKELLNK